MKPEELERHFSPGQLILARGFSSRDLFVIRQGEVLLERDDGSEPRLLGAGGVFGELGAILAVPSPYRAEAESEVTLLALEPKALNQLCAESPEFATRLLRHLAEALHGRDGEASRLGRIDRRLAQGYRKLVPVLFRRSDANETPAPVQGSLQELAGAAGLTVLDAYFCIQRLLESRALRLVDDQLAIVDAQPLEELGQA